jgi:hypothetical protein
VRRKIHGDVAEYLGVRLCRICKAGTCSPLDDFGCIFQSSCGRCFEDDLFASEIIPASSAVATLPVFAPDVDVQYVEVYEDEQLYAKVADAMADKCMVHYHCGTFYNVTAKSIKGGVHPLLFFVIYGRYIGVFSGW